MSLDPLFTAVEVFKFWPLLVMCSTKMLVEIYNRQKQNEKWRNKNELGWVWAPKQEHLKDQTKGPRKDPARHDWWKKEDLNIWGSHLGLFRHSCIGARTQMNNIIKNVLIFCTFLVIYLGVDNNLQKICAPYVTPLPLSLVQFQYNCYFNGRN